MAEGSDSGTTPGEGAGTADPLTPTKRRTLLVVDDNTDILESLTLLLKLAGYDILEAADGASSLQIIGRERPDLIVTDLRMPRMDGIDLIRWVREAGAPICETPIVALSVHGPRELESAQAAGADAWVDKLSDFEDLLRAVRQLLAT